MNFCLASTRRYLRRCVSQQNKVRLVAINGRAWIRYLRLAITYTVQYFTQSWTMQSCRGDHWPHRCNIVDTYRILQYMTHLYHSSPSMPLLFKVRLFIICV